MMPTSLRTKTKYNSGYTFVKPTIIAFFCFNSHLSKSSLIFLSSNNIRKKDGLKSF